MMNNVIKHTADSFCQGLIYHNDILYEKSFIQIYILLSYYYLNNQVNKNKIFYDFLDYN